MRFVMILVGFIVLCNFSYANEHVMDISKTDIFERTINFIIFVALMWYLVADKLKSILRERSQAIGQKLSQTQNKVKEVREKKEKAQQRLRNAHEQAKELVVIAKQEANISAQKIEEKTNEQIANLIKANEEAMEFQESLFQKEIVTEVLNEIFASEKLQLEVKDYANILERKVA